MTYEEAIRIVEKAKDMGVSELHLPGLTVRFKETKVEQKSQVPVPDKKADELIKPISVLDGITTEELLYYATPYFDELQAEKEAKANKMAGEPT